MITPIVLAVASAACFLGLAHAAVTMPPASFLRMTGGMASVAIALAFLSPAAGAAILGPVVLSRRLTTRWIPDTVADLLGPSPRLATE